MLHSPKKYIFLITLTIFWTLKDVYSCLMKLSWKERYKYSYKYE